MESRDKSTESLYTEPDAIRILKERRHELTADLKTARKPWKARGSFDLKWWRQAVKIEKISLERSEVDRKISLRSFDGVEEPWEKTDEGKMILERIKAEQQTKTICEDRVFQLQNGPPPRSLRSSFMKLFTTSSMGLAIKDTGAGQRNTSQQSNFRTDMIQAYEAKHPSEEWLWCPILGDYTDEDDVQASHLFPCMNGQDTMDAIFGKTRPEELFSPRNGLLICSKIERYFDAGKFVIVPDIPSVQENAWVSTVKDQRISRWRELTYGQLEDRKLRFRSSSRPAARYLYFHYCVQILRMCWQHSSQGKSSQAAAILQAEKGKPVWGSAGRYVPRNMLLALVEEMGHEYSFVLDGAAGSRADDNNLLLGLLSRNVMARPSLSNYGVFGDVSSEDEVTETEEDSDEE
ncbi:hypothetical protein N7465_007903 [Penicillium sp. CMV-2018d]|nr:hypothetical protein N7465_007903 [Penicillium sp. CMV-2018d]